jgi:3-oxoacyl-[acyl-carrier-protein] synthase II
MTSNRDRRVVVTGLGATTPLGGTATETWEALLAGRSGARTMDFDWVAKYELPVTFAATIATPPIDVLAKVETRRLDPSSQYALIAAREAWADAGAPEIDPERLGAAIGSGIGGVWTLLDQWDVLKEKGPRRVYPLAVPMLMPNGPAAAVSLDLGARAGAHTTVSACASGAESMGYAIDMIRTGRADVVVAGGTEAAVHPLPIAGFAAMRAMSTRNDDPEAASRPWDKNRDGFVLGEGAAVVVLERADHAAARGARVYAKLAGAAMTSDGFDIVQPDPTGTGSARAIRMALRDSGLSASDIVHVNAHATSTPTGDMAEIAGLRAVLGDHMVLTATKSMTGHLLGAAGALESIATILSIYHGIVPPTINLDDPEDGLMDVAAHKARHMEIPAALNNSFGFGGHNAALIFARP